MKNEVSLLTNPLHKMIKGINNPLYRRIKSRNKDITLKKYLSILFLFLFFSAELNINISFSARYKG